MRRHILNVNIGRDLPGRLRFQVSRQLNRGWWRVSSNHPNSHYRIDTEERVNAFE